MAHYKCPSCNEKVVHGKPYSEHYDICPAIEKWPIGLMPRYIWVDKRLQAITEACDRYTLQRKPIPIEWITEYNELVKEVT